MNHFVEDYICYLAFAGACQLIFFVVPSAMVWTRFAPSDTAVRDCLLFNAALLVFGGLGNALWQQIAFGKFYMSVDRLADFLPFWPYGQWVLDQSFGSEHGRLLNGATMNQLRLLWLLIAAPVWIVAVALVRALHRRAPAAFPSLRTSAL